MSQLQFAEAIDELELSQNKIENKKADYLLDNRRTIVELKSLQVDPEYKVHKELKKHRNRNEFPEFYGEMEVSKILKNLPDGNIISEKLFYKLSRSIENSFKKANKQIESTKKLFHCNEASGLLIFLNQEINILSPEVIANRISQLLTKKDIHSQTQYRHVTSVWIIIENYIIKDKSRTQLIPSIILEGPNAEKYSYLPELYDRLRANWAFFNDMPFFTSKPRKINDYDFVSLKEFEEANKKYISRQEAWRRNYQANRYLETLTDKSVIKHGVRFLKLMEPYLLKGGPKISKVQMGEFFRGFTHFLEEANLRGLDMKKLKLEYKKWIDLSKNKRT